MGMFSSITKKLKKVVKSATGGLLDGNEPKAPKEAPVVQTAAPAEVAKKDAEEDSTADTAASGKAAKAKGKRNLSVARSQGTGVNL